MVNAGKIGPAEAHRGAAVAVHENSVEELHWLRVDDGRRGRSTAAQR